MRVLVRVGTALVVAGLAPLGLTVMSAAPAVPAEVTFTKHIAPIIQRSCENCHRPDGVAPMSLVTYEDARPWARAMKQRTGIGPKAGVMPPWYVEKNIGIQKFHNDPSLSDDEIATIPGPSARRTSSSRRKSSRSRETRPIGGARFQAFQPD